MPTTSVICRSLSLSPKPMVSSSEQPRKSQMALMPVPLLNFRLMSSPFTMPPFSSPKRDSQNTNWSSYNTYGGIKMIERFAKLFPKKPGAANSEAER